MRFNSDLLEDEGSEWACSARVELDLERSSEQSWERTSTAFMVFVVVVGWGWEADKGSSSASEVGERGA